jgi:ribosomal-protein-alanine N-acetyltransferase
MRVASDDMDQSSDNRSDHWPGLRVFQRDDLDEILRLEARSFPDDAYEEALFLAWQRQNPDLFLVALGDEAIVGYVIATVEGGVGKIVSIAVDPDQRRRGIGKGLAQEILRRLQGTSVSTIILETRHDNIASISMWAELGFRQIGTAPGYYEDGADALIMSRTTS